MNDRHTQLLSALAAAPGASLSGAELGEHLGVSSRSIRQYVRDLNRRADREIVHATHRGYQLDPPAYAAWQALQPTSAPRYDTPQQRLYFVVRHLITYSSTGTDVFELGDLLSVSSSTIEADLSRARGLFHEHDLTIRRQGDLLYLDGSERDKRRLVRQVVLQAAKGITPPVMQGFSQAFEDYDVGALSQGLQRQFVGTDLELDEYALNDIVIHLTIAAARVRQGYPLAASDLPARDVDPDDITERIIAEVAEAYGVTLPASEAALVSVMLNARAKRRSPLPNDAAVHQESLQLVRDAMREVSATYLLEFYDEGALMDLAFHVQNLIERARQGVAFDNPLGDSFKNMHPLIHEFTLVFAGRLESQAGITVSPGEVGFLSFHLGNHFQRQLEKGAPITVTIVVPRYGNAHNSVLKSLSAALGDQAVITGVVSTLEYPWASLATDLIVSAVDLTGLTTIPVVAISPLLRREDIERVMDAVRAERERAARQQVRSSILTLVEPELFHRLPKVASKEEALAIMCQAMHAEGFTDESFLDDVLDRENRSATAFGGPFAIPHSMKMDAHRPGISVLITEKGIPWGGSSVRLVVLLAVSPDSGRLFRDVLEGWIRVLTEPANMAALLAASDSHAGFVHALASLLE